MLGQPVAHLAVVGAGGLAAEQPLTAAGAAQCQSQVTDYRTIAFLSVRVLCKILRLPLEIRLNEAHVNSFFRNINADKILFHNFAVLL